MSEIELEFNDGKQDVPKVEIELNRDKQDKPADSAEADAADDIESKAYKQGWRPKDKFNGNPKDWVDAETYVERGPYFRRMEEQKKQIEDLRKVVESMSRTVSKAEERAYNKAIADIEAKKAHARQSGDIRQYEQVMEEQQRIMQDHVTNNQPTNKIDPKDILETSEFKQFAAENSWVYGQSPEDMAKRAYAAAVDNEFERINPNATLSEKLDNVVKAVNKFYNIRPDTAEDTDDAEDDHDDGGPVMKAPKTLSPRATPKPEIDLEKGKFKTKESEFVRRTQHLAPEYQEMAESMFRDGEDWESYVKLVSPTKKNRK